MVERNDAGFRWTAAGDDAPEDLARDDLYAQMPDATDEAVPLGDGQVETGDDKLRLATLHQGTADYLEIDDAPGVGPADVNAARAAARQPADAESAAAAAMPASAPAPAPDSPAAATRAREAGTPQPAVAEPAARAGQAPASGEAAPTPGPEAAAVLAAGGAAPSAAPSGAAVAPPAAEATPPDTRVTGGTDSPGESASQADEAGIDQPDLSSDPGAAGTGSAMVAAPVPDSVAPESPLPSATAPEDAPLVQPLVTPPVTPVTAPDITVTPPETAVAPVVIPAVDEAPTGLTFTAAALSENVAAGIAGQVTATDPEGGALTFTVDDPRFTVDPDGTLRLADGVSLDHETTPQVALTLTATDAGGNTADLSVTVDVGDEVTASPDITTAGMFHVRQIAVVDGVTDLAGVDWGSDPVAEAFYHTIDFAQSGQGFLSGDTADAFATLVTGRIAADTAGTYEFMVPSTDSTLLWIDGAPVVIDLLPGVLGSGTASVMLDAGPHEIVIQHLNLDNDSELRLEWKAPGESAFSLTPASDALIVESDESLGLGVVIDTGLNLQGQVALHDVPGHWIVSDGDNTRISTGEPIDLTGWDMDQLHLSPASGDVGTFSLTLEATALSASGEPGTAQHAIAITVLEPGAVSVATLDLGALFALPGGLVTDAQVPQAEDLPVLDALAGLTPNDVLSSPPSLF